MKNGRDGVKRRDFLEKALRGGLAGAMLVPQTKLPQRPLGNTGVKVSVLAFGGGSHFLGRVEGDEKKVEQLIHRALELGITYFDTAAGYTYEPHERLSETYYGRILPPYRKQIFLASKAQERDRDGMLRSVETSLELLGTDYLDLIQMHSLQNLEELGGLESPDGALTALRSLKDEKTVRFIGATGHYDPEVLFQAVKRFELDTLLVPLNAAQASHPLSMKPNEPVPAFEDRVLLEAQERGIGVIAMKGMGQGSLLGDGEDKATPEELIRYALSLPVATLDISHTSIPILEQNAAAAQSFRPMSGGDLATLRGRLGVGRPVWEQYLRRGEEQVD